MEAHSDDEVIVLKRRKFSLKTESTCFLCCSDIFCPDTPNRNVDEDNSYYNCKGGSSSHSSIKAENDYSGEISLGGVCRYLRINFRQVLRDCDKHQTNIKLLLEERMADLSVQLCEQCFHIIKPLSNLCMQLELLQMRVENHLKSACEVLQNSESERSSFDVTENKGHHQDIAKLLRNEMKRKCQLKLDHATPKVKLIKIPSILLDAQVLKMTSNVKMEHVLDYSSDDENNDGVEPPCDSDSSPEKMSESDSNSQSQEKPHYLSYQPCKLCNPPRQVQVCYIRRHNTCHHIETMFISSKLPHITTMEFKEYCKYVVQVEVLSCKKLYDAKGNLVNKCSYCSVTFRFVNNMRSLRNHMCTLHKKIVSRKVLELQRNTTFDELKEMQLTLSRVSSDQRLNSYRRLSKCNACGQVFQHYESLNRHQRERHGKKKKLKLSIGSQVKQVCKCEVCDKIFQFRNSLQRHRKKAHNLQKPQQIIDTPLDSQGPCVKEEPAFVTCNSSVPHELSEESLVGVYSVGQEISCSNGMGNFNVCDDEPDVDRDNFQVEMKTATD